MLTAELVWDEVKQGWRIKTDIFSLDDAMALVASER